MIAVLKNILFAKEKNNMLISLKNIGFSYRYPLFEKISETLEIGDLLAIYGPSWVGKSTLLEIIGNIRKPSNGKIFFDSSLSDRQKDFWYSFVGGPFFEEMTVRENILFLEFFSKITIDRDFYGELLEIFEIKNLENLSVKNLSAGQRERVNMVRAFVHKPKIVILDEPGSNLDARLFEKTLQFLKNQKNSVICVATHHHEYREIATKIITLQPLS